MFFSTEEDIENQVTLGGSLEPFLLDVFKKDFVLFSLWFFCRHHVCVDFSTRGGERKEWALSPKFVSSFILGRALPQSRSHSWTRSVQGAVATWSNHASQESLENIAC